MAESAETVNSIRYQRVPKNVQFDVAHLRNRGSFREPTLHFLMATQILASFSGDFSTGKRWFADRL